MYHSFVAELHARGLIMFERFDDPFFSVGHFCVLKKTGALRLVFDTRLANMQFINPPVTALPSAVASCVVKVESTDGQRQFFMATADISNAFYNMMLSKDMWQCFSLPPVSPLGLPLARTRLRRVDLAFSAPPT